MGIGFQELLLILIIVVILFGGARFVNIGSGLGKGIREFKKALHGDEEPKDNNKTT